VKIEYFTDTDTLLIEFSDNAVVDTRDPNENALVEFDADGKLVSITIEHASEQGNVKEFAFHPQQGAEDGVCKVAEESPEYKTQRT
jgi:uncharacterized protein YuzE